MPAKKRDDLTQLRQAVYNEFKKFKPGEVIPTHNLTRDLARSLGIVVCKNMQRALFSGVIRDLEKKGVLRRIGWARSCVVQMVQSEADAHEQVQQDTFSEILGEFLGVNSPPSSELPDGLTALQIGEAVARTILQQQKAIGELSEQLQVAREDRGSNQIKILKHQLSVADGRIGWLTKRAKEAEDKCADKADQIIIYERRILELTEQLRRIVKQPAVQLSVLGLSPPNKPDAAPAEMQPGGNGGAVQ